MTDDNAARYLTTREVADLLRVKERKVYDLAAAGAIPHRRVVGKLLFPEGDIRAWIDGGADASRGDGRPAVLTGSHDPLLDWATRESESGLATLLNGSYDGLDAFAEGRAALAGLHIPEDADGPKNADRSKNDDPKNDGPKDDGPKDDGPKDDGLKNANGGEIGWNVATVAGRGLRDCVLIGWAVRSRGLILSDAARKQVAQFADLRGRRVALRQPGAGARALFDRLMAQAGLGDDDVAAAGALARTESDAAAAVAAGDADAAIGLEAMARRFHLGFLPIVEERFDLLIDRRAYFSAPVQTLLAFAHGDAFRDKAAAMGGYDLADAGAVRWLSP